MRWLLACAFLIGCTTVKVDTMEECRWEEFAFGGISLDTKVNCSGSRHTKNLGVIESNIEKAIEGRVVEMIEKQDSGEVPAEYWEDKEGNLWIKREQ